MNGERGRCRILVRGVVQGVGFRPFVYTTAAELALTGSVANDSAGVTIDVEGAPAALAEFADRLHRRPPPLAVIESNRANRSAPARRYRIPHHRHHPWHRTHLRLAGCGGVRGLRSGTA